MNFLKKLPIYILLLVLSGLAFWAIFVPKEDFVKRVTQRLEEQKERADLFFRGVTVAEIVDGKKYWELRAISSELNKTTNITNLTTVRGTFFEKGNPELRIIAPTAVWHMKEKEIYLSEPIGYDTKFEKAFRHKLGSLRKLKDPRAIFNLPHEGDSGYWFKAHNLAWKLATKKINCTDGIMLAKGNIVVLSDELEADVAMENVKLIGSPRANVDDNITCEATTIKVDSKNDLIYALGGSRMLRSDAVITSDSALYRQRSRELELLGNVHVTSKDLEAWGNNALYLVDSERAVLSGEARALRGNNALSGDEVSILFKEDKVTVSGRTQVKISGSELTREAR